MDSFKNFTKSIQSLKDNANKMIDEALTPEVLDSLSPEQMEIVSGSMSAFDLNGKSTKQKAEEINNLIKKSNAAFNS